MISTKIDTLVAVAYAKDLENQHGIDVVAEHEALTRVWGGPRDHRLGSMPNDGGRTDIMGKPIRYDNVGFRITRRLK